MIEQHSTLAEKFLKKWFWLYLFSFIIGPIWYVVKIIISWELSVSDVGILYWIISLVTLISAYNDLWMTESLKHFIPKFITEERYDKVKSILFYAFIAQIWTSLIIASFFFFWADFISESYFKTQDAKEILKVFAFFFIWINIFQVINTFFLAIQNTFLNKLTELIRMWFIMFSVFFIFFWDLWSLSTYSYSWLIWLYLGIIFSLLIFYFKYYKRYFSNVGIIYEKKLMKEIFKYAYLVFIWASAATILGQIDMQMIIYLLGTTDAWYYTNYLSIIGIPFIIIWPIFALLFPIFSEMHSKWEIEKIKLIKHIFQKNFLSIWIAFNILFFVFAEVIAYTLFWEKFIESWVILKYSILLLIFNFLLQINFNIMAWIWKVSERVKIIFIAVIFNFIMNLILINLLWVYWASLATWLGWILIWLLSEILLWKDYKSSFNIGYLLKNLFLMWGLGFLIYEFCLPLFIWLSRFNSFLLLSIFWIIYFWFFAIINYKEVKFFILEVKRLRRW